MRNIKEKLLEDSFMLRWGGNSTNMRVIFHFQPSFHPALPACHRVTLKVIKQALKNQTRWFYLNIYFSLLK
jgi:hypothetical protein